MNTPISGLVLLTLFSVFQHPNRNDMTQKEDTGRTYPVRHISVTIDKPARDVYEFTSNPENLPRWAAGLSGSIRKEGADWIADSPMGEVKVSFAPENTFGILDHNVTLPSGETVYNPLRVIQNNHGSEVVFTLYHLPGRSESEFLEDAGMVEKDLNSLKQLMEQQ
jgi:uncharacterized membrane protein